VRVFLLSDFHGVEQFLNISAEMSGTFSSSSGFAGTAVVASIVNPFGLTWLSFGQTTITLSAGSVHSLCVSLSPPLYLF
jgi:hypothetical protein